MVYCFFTSYLKNNNWWIYVAVLVLQPLFWSYLFQLRMEMVLVSLWAQRLHSLREFTKHMYSMWKGLVIKQYTQQVMDKCEFAGMVLHQLQNLVTNLIYICWTLFDFSGHILCILLENINPPQDSISLAQLLLSHIHRYVLFVSYVCVISDFEKVFYLQNRVLQTPNSIGQTNVGSSHLLTQNAPSGTFIIQSTVEPDTSHNILSGTRSSPQTVAAVRFLMDSFM